MPFDTDLLAALPADLRAYFIARESAYQEHISTLQQRIDVLEEQFRLAQLKRFAPSSEKYGMQGCPSMKSSEWRKRPARPLPMALT